MTVIDRLLAAMDVSVRSFSADTTTATRSRTHGAAEATAVHVLSGVGRLLAAGGFSAPVAPETFVLVPAGVDWRFETDATLVSAVGLVRATFAGGAGPFDRLKAPLAASFAAHPMRESFRMLVDEFARPTIGAHALAGCIVKQALVLLLRAEPAVGVEPLPFIVALRDERLARAVAAILERPSDPLTLDALARLAGMSRSVFSERFGAAFGQSPIDFLKDVRLARAARLLATTDLPVKRIASAVGYGSRSYFSRAFRSRYASDPSDYRGGRSDAA